MTEQSARQRARDMMRRAADRVDQAASLGDVGRAAAMATLAWAEATVAGELLAAIPADEAREVHDCSLPTGAAVVGDGWVCPRCSTGWSVATTTPRHLFWTSTRRVERTD